MKRRKFLQAAAVGVMAGAVASPAVAQTSPSIRWRLATSWPKSLDTIHGGVEDMAKRVGQLTEGKFQIQVFAGDEIVPPLQVFDATQAGTIECGHTLASFYFGKNPAFAFDAGLAFGLNARQQNAWLYYGGGLELLRELFAKYGIVQIGCGNVGVQMGGFYRKEINTVDDLKGLKFRIGGIGGSILSKLGVVPQQIPPPDIYPALERGTIDAAEWIGPYDDEKLGLLQGRQVLLLPRLVGGFGDEHAAGQQAALRCAAAAVQGCARCRLQRAELPDDRQIRRQEPGGAAQAGGCRASRSASFRDRCSMPATRRRSKPSRSLRRRTRTSRKSTSPGRNSSRNPISGSASPRAPWTATATRCRRSSASFNQTAAVFARCGSLPFWEDA